MTELTATQEVTAAEPDTIRQVFAGESTPVTLDETKPPTFQEQATALVHGANTEFNMQTAPAPLQEGIAQLNSALGQGGEMNAAEYTQKLHDVLKDQGLSLSPEQQHGFQQIAERALKNEITQEEATQLIMELTNAEAAKSAGLPEQDQQQLAELQTGLAADQQELTQAQADGTSAGVIGEKRRAIMEKLQLMGRILKKVGFIALVLCLGPIMTSMMSMGTGGGGGGMH